VPDTYGLSLIAHHVQIVGQSLTLECSLTTYRGITSVVRFMWSSGGTNLKEEVKTGKDFTTQNLDIYSNTYIIPQLSVSDDGRTYQCKAVINTNPTIVEYNNVTLKLTGIVLYTICLQLCQCFIFHSSYSYSQYNTIWCYTRRYGR